MDDETISELAKREADETFESITDLDSISDTTIVGVTFLLSAVGVWTSFALNRFPSDSSPERLLVTLTGLCIVTIGCSLYYLIGSLFPRFFYTSDVGTTFLSAPFPVPNRDTATADQFIDEDELKSSFEGWLDAYHSETVVQDATDFQLARFHNYKHVARIKARNTAYGLAWLRISIFLFVLIVVFSLLAPYFV